LHNSSADRARENNALALRQKEKEQEAEAGGRRGAMPDEKQETREENKKGRENGKEPWQAGDYARGRPARDVTYALRAIASGGIKIA